MREQRERTQLELATLSAHSVSVFTAGECGSLAVGTDNQPFASFLVADQVEVASLPPQSSKNPNPAQYVFSSSANEGSFEIYPDPRGNTLGHGTEITLYLRSDASHYLVTSNLMKLMYVSSLSYRTAF